MTHYTSKRSLKNFESYQPFFKGEILDGCKEFYEFLLTLDIGDKIQPSSVSKTIGLKNEKAKGFLKNMAGQQKLNKKGNFFYKKEDIDLSDIEEASTYFKFRGESPKKKIIHGRIEKEIFVKKFKKTSIYQTWEETKFSMNDVELHAFIETVNNNIGFKTFIVMDGQILRVVPTNAKMTINFVLGSTSDIMDLFYKKYWHTASVDDIVMVTPIRIGFIYKYINGRIKRGF